MKQIIFFLLFALCALTYQKFDLVKTLDLHRNIKFIVKTNNTNYLIHYETN
jgi:hypothetical protein